MERDLMEQMHDDMRAQQLQMMQQTPQFACSGSWENPARLYISARSTWLAPPRPAALRPRRLQGGRSAGLSAPDSPAAEHLRRGHCRTIANHCAPADTDRR